MTAWAQSEAERGGILAMVVLSVWIVGGVQEGRRERGRAREVLGERKGEGGFRREGTECAGSSRSRRQS